MMILKPLFPEIADNKKSVSSGLGNKMKYKLVGKKH